MVSFLAISELDKLFEREQLKRFPAIFLPRLVDLVLDYTIAKLCKFILLKIIVLRTIEPSEIHGEA